MNAAILFVAGALVVAELPPQQPVDPQDARAVHDRLFRGFLPGDITGLLAKSSGDINLPDPVIPPQWIHLPEPRDQMQNLVCGPDLVAVMTAREGVSRLTADGGNIYSEWQFSLNEILKDDKKATGPRSGVTILIRGGTIQLQGRKVHVANDDFFGGFRPAGSYLLFLYRVPETGAYRASSGFALDNEQVQRLSKHSRFLQLETMSRAALVSLTRNAIAAVASIPDCASGG